MSGASRSPVSAWWWAAPVLLAAGALLGHWLWPVRAAIWSEPARDVAAPDAPRYLPSLAPLVQRVRDGVVGIRTIRRRNAAPTSNATAELAGGSQGVVHGTGFIIHESGLAVTNHHLIAEHDRIIVEIPELPPVEAELVGADPVTDIAVVRFEPPAGELTVLRLGDSTRIQQGDWVLAMGNPFQFTDTVTFGIVSYVGRHLPEEGMRVSNEYLQFSATVYPGSSGGPVIDMQGSVVGVTTSAHTGGTGIAFAVPSKVLKWVLERMDESGTVRRGFLGVSLEPLDLVAVRGLGIDGGALVQAVEDGRPAAMAGLEAGDVVITYNGAPVPDAYTLFDWITYSRPDEPAVLEVLRNGARVGPLVARLGQVEVPAAPIAGAQDPPQTEPVY